MNTPSSKPKSKPPKQSLNPQEQVMFEQAMKLQQLERIIWLLVTAGQETGEARVREIDVNPLFTLTFTRENEKDLMIVAGALPEPAEAQISALAGLLKGTGSVLKDEAMQFGLTGYPDAYLRFRLTPFVVFKDGKWEENKKQHG